MSRWSVSFFLLFVGSGIWAGMHFWLTMYSGQQIAGEEIFRVSDAQVLDSRAASEIRHRPDQYKAFSLELSPEMNSVGMYFSYEKRRSSSGQSEFTVELESSDGDVIETLHVRLRNRGGSSSSGASPGTGTTRASAHVATFDMPIADSYLVRVVPGDRQGVPTTALSVQMRRNVWIPPFANLIVAILTSIFAMAGGIISVVVRRRAQADRRQLSERAQDVQSMTDR